MADRTSAALFCELFEFLAGNELLDRKAFARALWEKSQGYDFSNYQLGCDEALIKLGLARRGVDPNYPDDGETILYGPEEQP